MDSGITIKPYSHPVTVRFHNVVIASTERALELLEPGHNPVLYIPFDDIYFAHLEKTETSTKCPWKGNSILLEGHRSGRVGQRCHVGL